MRTIAISGAVCGLVLAVTGVSVGGDFDALLADLTFGDAPSVTLDVAVEEHTETLQPAPDDGFLMPVPDKTAATPAAAPIVALTQPIESPEFDSPELIETPPAIEAPEFAEIAPPVTEEADVDFEQVFTNQDAEPTDAALAPIPVETPAGEPAPAEPMPVPVVNPAPVAPIAGGCNRGCNTGCDEAITCVPHDKVVLPNSTLRQYFRSNKCYVHVWDGYRQKCGSSHDHLMGNCDCFDPNRKGCLGVEKNCESCDACDR